jgi:hypothetical protein
MLILIRHRYQTVVPEDEIVRATNQLWKVAANAIRQHRPFNRIGR